MTGAELLAYVKKVFKRTDKDTEVYEAITDTVAHIKTRVDPDAYKTLTTSLAISTLGEYKIAVPAATGTIIGDVIVKDGENSYELVKKTKAEFDRLYPNQDATDAVRAMPDHWCLYGGYIYLGHNPDKTTYTYTLNYTTGTLETITASTASVPFSARYRECLRAGTLKRAFQLVENADLAEYWGVQFEGPQPDIEVGGLLGQILREERRNAYAPGSTQYQDI